MHDLNNLPEEPKEETPSERDEFSLRKIIPGVSPIAGAFIGLVGGFLLYQLVGGVLTLMVFGMKLEDAPVNSLRLMTMGGQILFILLPALLFTKWFYTDITRVLRVKVPDLRELVLFTIGSVVITPLLQYYIMIQEFYIDKFAAASTTVFEIKKFLDDLNVMVEKTYGDLLVANNPAEGLLVILVVAVVPSICEEAMFRGFIQRSFEFKIKPFWAALITAIFFGIYHFNPYGLVPLIALGLYFGFAAYMSNSIVVPVFLHFLNNFTAIMVFFIVGNKDLLDATASQNVDLHSTLIIFFVLLVLFAVVIYFIKRYYKKKKWSEHANMPEL